MRGGLSLSLSLTHTHTHTHTPHSDDDVVVESRTSMSLVLIERRAESRRTRDSTRSTLSRETCSQAERRLQCRIMSRAAEARAVSAPCRQLAAVAAARRVGKHKTWIPHSSSSHETPVTRKRGFSERERERERTRRCARARANILRVRAETRVSRSRETRFEKNKITRRFFLLKKGLGSGLGSRVCVCASGVELGDGLEHVLEVPVRVAHEHRALPRLLPARVVADRRRHGGSFDLETRHSRRGRVGLRARAEAQHLKRRRPTDLPPTDGSDLRFVRSSELRYVSSGRFVTYREFKILARSRGFPDHFRSSSCSTPVYNHSQTPTEWQIAACRWTLHPTRRRAA